MLQLPASHHWLASKLWRCMGGWTISSCVTFRYAAKYITSYAKLNLRLARAAEEGRRPKAFLCVPEQSRLATRRLMAVCRFFTQYESHLHRRLSTTHKRLKVQIVLLSSSVECSLQNGSAWEQQGCWRSVTRAVDPPPDFDQLLEAGQMFRGGARKSSKQSLVK